MQLFKDSQAQLSNSTRQRTNEGYLIVDALIARTGIQEYQGYELPKNIGIKVDPERTYKIYRPAKEVFSQAALQSFAQKPVTNEHPYDVGGAVDSNTATQKLVGVSGAKAERVGNQIKIPLVLYSASSINDVEQGKVGLSAGYDAEVKMTPGVTPDGQQYDGVMYNIRGNHIAICDLSAARGGQGCRILDKNQRGYMKTGLQNNMQQDADPQMGGADGVPDLSDINQIGQMIQKLTSTLQAGFKSVLAAVQGNDSGTENESEDEGAGDDPVVPLTDEDDATAGQKVVPAPKNKDAAPSNMKATDSKILAKLQQEIAYLKGQLQVSKKTAITDSQINRVVSSRVKLIREAEQVLPGEDFTMLDSIEIKKRVIKSAMPDIVLDSHPSFIDGAYQSCIGNLLRGANSSFGLANAINDSYSSGGENSQGEFTDVDSGKFAEEKFKELQARRKAQFDKGSK